MPRARRSTTIVSTGVYAYQAVDTSTTSHMTFDPPRTRARRKTAAPPLSNGGGAVQYAVMDGIPISFVSSGGTLLDLVLGGGWATRRVINVVGDRSSGKTGLAIEACANFAQVTPVTNIRYVEAEHAFSAEYAHYMGMPHGVLYEDRLDTVEKVFADLEQFCRARINSPTPCLYVVDSLDSLSDDAEMKRELGDATYALGKPKMMSEMFRRRISLIEQAHCTLMIVSQLRDNIGVMFGEKQKRSGGRALDFYASQVVWLREIKKIEHTVSGVKRAVGVHVAMRNRKNKTGLPFRDAESTLIFGYGIDDEVSMMDWLESIKGQPLVLKDFRKSLDNARATQNREWAHSIRAALQEVVVGYWHAIDQALQPPMRKYG